MWHRSWNSFYHSGERLRLPERLAENHGRGEGHIERTKPWFERNAKARIRCCMHLIRHARRLTAEQQSVAAPEGKIGISHARARGQQHEAAGSARLQIDGPGDMAGD